MMTLSASVSMLSTILFNAASALGYFAKSALRTGLPNNPMAIESALAVVTQNLLGRI